MALSTPLESVHRNLRAKFMEFGGWDMPLQYAGIVQEHRAVRTRAGLFDISHMGKIELQGEEAVSFLQELTPNDVSKLALYQAHYSFLLDEAGGVIDDIIVYRLDGRVLVVVNAAGRAGDLAWIRAHAPAGLEVRDRTEEAAMLALQGPAAERLLEPLCDADLSGLKNYRAAEGMVAGVPALVLRTGYTGEDGFELIVDADKAEAVWQALMQEGPEPCGLGARDTLRLEAGMPLYGHELDRETTPLEAGLGRFVALDKTRFIGRQALLERKPRKQLAGFRMEDRSVPRNGYSVRLGGAPAGVVTSGSYSPTMEASIGMAYLPPQSAIVGAEIEVMVREQPKAARLVALPFYRRPRAASNRS